MKAPLFEYEENIHHIPKSSKKNFHIIILFYTVTLDYAADI